jgi:hypothetical protein
MQTSTNAALILLLMLSIMFVTVEIGESFYERATADKQDYPEQGKK